MKNINETVHEQILRADASLGMFPRGGRVVAAVSGGADSVCMLHALDALKSELGIEIVVAHLNHGARGADADADAAFTQRMAVETGLEFRGGKIGEDVAPPAGGGGCEAALRAARYGFLRRTAEETGASRIATAHTADDQAETVLMRFLKGASVTGLAGIRPVNGPVVRPLLEITRKQVEEYCAANGLEYCTDATNYDENYLRNSIRRSLIPALESEYNPRLREALVKMARNFRRDSGCLESMAEDALEAAAAGRGAKSVELDIGCLRGLSEAVLSRVVLMAAYGLTGAEDARIESGHVDEVMELVRRPDAGASAAIPGGISVTRGYSRLVFRRDDGSDDAGRRPSAEQMFIPSCPGTYRIDAAGLTLEIAEAPFNEELLKSDDAMTESFDASIVDGRRLSVRFPREGDRFRPLGLDGEKKLSDFFVDEKVDRTRRGHIPLLLCGDEIMWVVGMRIGHRFRLDPGRTGAVVKIKAAFDA